MLTSQRMMSSEEPKLKDDFAADDEERGRRMAIAAVAALATVVADALVLIWVVPWAEEEFDNPFMSGGYIVTFFLVFFNFVIAFALVSLVLHKDSYPSDRWI
ncbi:MAG: hypothetical protein AB1793_05865 [Candidatus Thermoplasmatota archaeon]